MAEGRRQTTGPEQRTRPQSAPRPAAGRRARRAVSAQPWKCLLYICICHLLCDSVCVALAFGAIGDAAGAVYLKMVLLPLGAFIAAFLSLLAVRRAKLCLLVACTVHLLVFWLSLGFSGFAFLWNILYVFSALLGMLIAYITLTHREKS